MTLQEALSKVTVGYYARHDGMAPNSYIYYEFNGWRLGFNHDGRVGSSSLWHWDEADEAANWYVSDTEVPAAWGNFQTICWDIDAAIDAPFEQWKEEVQYSTTQVPMLAEDEVICVPTCWDVPEVPDGFINPYAPDAKEQLEVAMNEPVKTGWAMFDKKEQANENSSN